MANSDNLRNNMNQHHSKNTYSKNDDKNIFFAQEKVKKYLEDRFHDIFNGKDNYYISWENNISFDRMYTLIHNNKLRFEFDFQYGKRTIKPDGGILYLKKKNDSNYIKVLLIAEVKRQGTNDIRAKEGKPKQAQGNAIERLGKNLIGIKSMMNHEKITPFVCFGWGCDFDITENDFVLSKVSMMNEFYPLNKIYLFKKDGDSGHNFFSPVSMFFRKEKWSIDEMFEVMREIAETAVRYYIF